MKGLSALHLDFGHCQCSGHDIPVLFFVIAYPSCDVRNVSGGLCQDQLYVSYTYRHIFILRYNGSADVSTDLKVSFPSICSLSRCRRSFGSYALCFFFFDQ